MRWYAVWRQRFLPDTQGGEMIYLRHAWSRSKAFRIALVVAVVWAVLRLAVHGWYISDMWFAPLPGDEPEVPNDLQDYLDAAVRLQLRQDLYLEGPLDRVEFYQYAPSYALVFIPFLWLPSPFLTAILHTLLHLLAYGFLYLLWVRMFHRLGLDRVGEHLCLALPLWLAFAAFWGDLAYLNVYIIVALLSTLLIAAILDERLGWSLLWLSIILQVKPHWAFAAVLPLLLGRWRFFLRLVGLAILTYAAIVGLMMLILGPSYIWQQYAGYVRFLWSMRSNFPWRGPEAAFLGYNHSITQIVVYLLGVTPAALHLATGIKVVLLIPLVLVCSCCLLQPARRTGGEVPRLGLDLAFALYLGVFIWLDMVWELSLGVVLFAYLLATLERRGARVCVWAAFLPYAMVDFWQVVSYALFGEDVVLPGFYFSLDPSIYLPMIMLVILAFYALLVVRLWTLCRQASSRRVAR
jgi:hypothetical protein